AVGFLLTKQAAGYNEALPRCNSMLNLLRSFFWCLNPPTSLQHAEEISLIYSTFVVDILCDITSVLVIAMK
ncbi:MAG: hypothetical protein PHC92_11975, partial [Syntrophomonadaceae bacterium]|nr:hypothetical protein [Syntrophomonadaceae bacterium]